MDYNEAEDAVKVIQRLNQYAESLCQRLQDAQAENDRLRIENHRIKSHNESMVATQKNTVGLALDREAEIAKLREALEQAQMQERARCLNLINSYVLRTRVKPQGAVGLALAAVANMMKGADDD